MSKDKDDEEILKDNMVRQVQIMAALFAEYTKHLQLDAYECTLEFMFTDGEGRIRLTDSKFKMDPGTGKLRKLPNESNDPHASSLDDAEARRRGVKPVEEPDPVKVPSPEETVAALMKKLRLK
jgi:hypothetical protein